MTPEQEQGLLKKIAISFDDFQDWIDTNTPAGWQFEDTNDVLAYMGYIQFHMYKQSLPDVTLEQLSTVFFGSKTESKDMLKFITKDLQPTNH